MIAADTTTLTALCLIGRVDLVRRLFGKIVISSTADEELRKILRALDPDCEPPSPDIVEVVAVDISAPAMSLSESETLELCRRVTASHLLTDDPVVRAEAKKQGTNCIGTLGVLHAARARGIIQDIEEALARLRQVGYAAAPECERVLLDRSTG